MSDDNFTYEVHFRIYGIAYLQRTQVKFVYDYRVKVKVTGAKKVANSGSCNDRLRSEIFIGTRQMEPQTTSRVVGP